MVRVDWLAYIRYTTPGDKPGEIVFGKPLNTFANPNDCHKKEGTDWYKDFESFKLSFKD